jgi:hypothetical protein
VWTYLDRQKSAVLTPVWVSADAGANKKALMLDRMVNQLAVFSRMQYLKYAIARAFLGLALSLS